MTEPVSPPVTLPGAASLPWWHWARLREINPYIVDALFAGAMLTISVLTFAFSDTDVQHSREPDALGYALTIVAFGALIWRRAHPMAVFVIAITATFWFSAADYPESGHALACLIALYTVATLMPRAQSLVAAGVTALVIVALTILGSQGLDFGGMVSNFALFGIAYATGSYVRVRRQYTEQLELRAQDLEETRRREAEQAVAEERLRIARELHDVVAHAMSVVAVQSGVAAHVIDQDPAQAKTMLANINTTSREALDEMRRMLGVLRAEGEAPAADLAPAPSLGDLRSLVSSVETTGVSVDLCVEGEAQELVPGLDLAAFRVVQEALTNVVKHAGPAHVAVNVRYGDQDVEVEVVDDGRGAATEVADAGGGHGLAGMRERVDLYGGTLAAGPRVGGGFAVRATLPYRSEAPVV